MKAEATPEELELHDKQEHLATLLKELADAELELLTLQSQLEAFEREYHLEIGLRYAELDMWESRIAALLAERKPDVSHFRRMADQAAAKARASAESAKVGESAVNRPPMGEDLKALFRKAAILIHPDLAVDEEDRKRRDKKMAELNAAAAAGDGERVRRIIADWASSPDEIRGDGVGAELVRTIRKVHQARRRLEVIEKQLGELVESELGQLFTEIENGKTSGRDLLADLKNDLDALIANAKTRFRQLDGL